MLLDVIFQMCGMSYIDEVKLVAENNINVQKTLSSFASKNKNLKKDITTAKKALEQDMAATFTLLFQKNETYKVIINHFYRRTHHIKIDKHIRFLAPRRKLPQRVKYQNARFIQGKYGRG